MKLLISYGLIHGDIKDDNIVLIEQKEDSKMRGIRMIDMGGINDLIQPTCFTEFFFMSPYISQFGKNDTPIFEYT